MRMQLRSLLATVAVVCASFSSTRAIDIYVISGNSTNISTDQVGFGKIDSTTGAYTSIVATLPNYLYANLAWDPSISKFYTQGAGQLGANSPLETIDTQGNVSAPIGSPNNTLYGMVYRPTDSQIYAYSYSDKTGTINPSNGAWTNLNTSPGLSTSSPVGGRYALLNDTIYFAAAGGGGKFGTMGFTASSSFSQIASNFLFANMVLASDGTSLFGIYGNGNVGSQTLFTINPADGTLSAGIPISGPGLGSIFSGAGTTVVPEPSTYALAAIGTGIMAAVARRRKARKA